MANTTIFLICILASYTLAQIDPNREHKVLDVRYETGCQQYFNNSHQVLTYKAPMGCSVNNGKFLVVCAELPRNWHWDALYGYLYMDLYNKENGAASDRLNTSRTAPGQVPLQCLTIKSWPGGDLYIKVQSNNFRPVYFTLSVIVTPTSIPMARHQTTGSSQSLPVEQMGSSYRLTDPTECKVPVESGTGNYLMSTLFLTDDVEKLEVQHSLEARLDVCAYKTTKMLMSVQGTTGAYTFYVCTTSPCDIDSRSVIASQNTPLVVSSKQFAVPPSITSVYTLITSYTGEEDPVGSKKYYGSFTFGGNVHD